MIQPNKAREGRYFPHVFIPSYHRPENIKTAKYFKKLGWDMDRVTVFVDSEADDIEDYRHTAKVLGFNLNVFDMEEARRRYDYIHRASVSRRSAGQARNMFQDYALAFGIDFYWVIDDDTESYTTFMQRHKIKDLDLVRRVFVDIESLMRRRKIGVFGLSQTGDFIWGYNKALYLKKVMNTTAYLMPYISGRARRTRRRHEPFCRYTQRGAIYGHNEPRGRLTTNAIGGAIGGAYGLI